MRKKQKCANGCNPLQQGVSITLCITTNHDKPYSMRLQFYLSFIVFFLATTVVAQQWNEPKINEGDPALPAWVKLMYAAQPNVRSVDSAYAAWYRHRFEKNSYTQYYKRWRRHVQSFINAEGFIVYPSNEDYQRKEQLARTQRGSEGQRPNAANWISRGPDQVFSLKQDDAAQPPVSWQVNTYSIDRSLSNPDILYCATESAGIYKTINKGVSWQLVTANYLITSARGVRIHPTDPNIVLLGSRGQVFKTTDGGATWNLTGDAVFQSLNLQALEIAFHPSNPSIVMMATTKGLFRSVDGGNNWLRILVNECRTVVFKPGDPNTVYTMQYNPATKIADFYKSTDAGVTFTIKPTGWFTVPAADAGLIDSKGGKLAVTEANPNKIYALLVGQSQSGATLQLNGFIGVYVSSDAGETWTHPHGQIGAPYSSSHPNLMNFSGDNGTYNQIYYNTTMIASQLNENRIIVGGLSMWRSDNGASTYSAVGGYVGTVRWVHPDQQELKVYKLSASAEEVWCANDGGVNLSNDFYTTHESKAKGIAASDFWGFDVGWDEEVMVGGRYHNGNAAMRENYTDNKYLRLGGGEAPTGYVNPGENHKTYYSDIGGRLLPEQFDGTGSSFVTSQYPNESYYVNNSSRMVFDPRCWNMAYLGKENKLYKSTDGGSSFKLLYTFGANTNDGMRWIELYKPNPDIFYVFQRVGNGGKLWKTSNGGTSFAEIPIPFNNYYEVPFTISATNPDELWVAFQKAGNGQKVYKTVNSGANWENLTSATLNNLRINNIVHQEGTNGGVYIASDEGGVFYRNNSLTDWQSYSMGLPLAVSPTRTVPFYRKNKVKLAGNFGIWETDMYETSSNVAQISADRLYAECAGDTVTFKDHSVSSDPNLTYQWTFPGGNPSSSTTKTQKVAYPAPGLYNVSLTINGTGGSSSQTLNSLVKVDTLCNGIIDTIAGAAIHLPDNTSFASFKPLNISTNTITYMAWIRPTAFDNFAGVIFSRGGSNTASGINLINGSKLAFHFGDQGWWHNDGPVIPVNEWSHVALVISGTTVTYFVNGEQKIQWNDLSGNAVNFSSDIIMGRDPNYTNRNFQGNLDEVSIWNRVLNLPEIREMMHQTLKGTENGLKFYAQFNEPHNVFYLDKISNKRGYPAGNAGRIPSPVATGTGGVKTNMEVNGTMNFDNTSFAVQYSSNGGAQAVASRIYNKPSGTTGINATDTVLKKQYWVFNRFQTATGYNGHLSFTTLEDLNAADQANPATLKLYRRNFNAEGSWTFVKDASVVDAASDKISFNDITVSGQFMIAKNTTTTPVPNVDNDKTILVYPNPVLTTAVITAQQNFVKGSWELFNGQGQLMGFGNIRAGSNQFTVDMQGFAPGAYYLKIRKNEREVLLKKLIKQ